MSEPLLKSLEV